MKVLIFSAKSFEMPYLKAANRGKHKLLFTEESLTSETAMKALGCDAISIFSSDTASNIILEKLKDFGVKYITLRSVGHDNVNLFTAASLGFKVANVPAYSPYAVAEHGVALLLALNRKLIRSNQQTKQFNFDTTNLIGFDLNNKTVGIIGTGNIGSIMTKIMYGFGCRLIGYDTVKNENLIKDYHLKYQSLEQLCKEADIISIHVPLNSETHYLIDDRLIKLMKPNVIIINTARGAIINTQHIIKALDNKQIGALGLDVYEHEKDVFFKDLSDDIPNDDMLIKLLAMPNVLLTSHHAYLTDEALTNIADTTIDNLDSWDANKTCANELKFKTMHESKVL